jgi:hypothetical protein
MPGPLASKPTTATSSNVGTLFSYMIITHYCSLFWGKFSHRNRFSQRSWRTSWAALQAGYESCLCSYRPAPFLRMPRQPFHALRSLRRPCKGHHDGWSCSRSGTSVFSFPVDRTDKGSCLESAPAGRRQDLAPCCCQKLEHTRMTSRLGSSSGRTRHAERVERVAQDQERSQGSKVADEQSMHRNRSA